MKNEFLYKVYYEDTDAGGVVYYANYLKFLERARTDFLQQRGVFQNKLAKDNIFFVVKKCEIEYFFSAKLEDILTVSCVIIADSKVAVDFKQEIYVGGIKIVEAKVKIVCVAKEGENFKIQKIPLEIANGIHS
jgi:acyl-CoA thioester hydrolase